MSEPKFTYHDDAWPFYPPYGWVFMLDTLGFDLNRFGGIADPDQALLALSRAADWCRQQYGAETGYQRTRRMRSIPTRGRWAWTTKERVILFSQPNDAFEFRMRWC